MRCAAIFVAILLFAVPAAAADINVAGFANGALIESSTSDYSGWEADYLLDENPTNGWASQKNAKGPFTIVISLAERSTIRSFEFDNAHVDGVGRNTKDVDVFVSDVSANAGYARVLSTQLKAGVDGQKFALPAPATGRWIKLVIKSNYGDVGYTELMDFRAWGEQLTTSPLPANLSGTYASRYGDFHLLQRGAELSGCYEYASGLIHGGLESHLMRLTWTEGNNTGPAVMVMKRDGRGFVGWWKHATDTRWNANWYLTKKSDTVGSCPYWNPNGGSVIATELSTQGVSRLYGINFDVDKATLRPDALPEINELVGVLKANPAWRVSIGGHTDSTGNAAHNLDLSKRRADSVLAALVAAGIAADRMTAEGFGQTRPIATNDTDLGRAQNRRVEVVRK